MRIGVVTQKVGLNDGQGRVNYEITTEALRRGHEVVLFCEHIDSAIFSQPGVTAELMRSPRWLPTQLFKDQLFAWRSHRRLARNSSASAAATSRECDVLLANGFVTWTGADVNIVHFVHSSWERSPYHPWRQRRTPHSLYKYVYNHLNSTLERNAFRRSRSIVAVSNMVRRELLEIGVEPSAIVTIQNGVDATEFYPGLGNRARFDLPEASVIGLFAGDLKDSRKNLDSVLAAMVNVANFHLAVAGAHDGTPWPRLAAKLGVADRVHFLGFQTDMPELMRSVDLLVFPSRYETFGLVLLEALASALPVITARSSGGAELIAPDVGIVLEDCDDTDALCAALLAMVNSPERRRSMAAAARTIAAQYSWHQTAARYLDLLEDASQNGIAVRANQKTGAGSL